DSDREEYELDDKQLYEQVLQLINKLNQDALNK
ncbi:colicin immunity domain-containing protein, partial [Yersinia pseudotuberculosis]